MSFLLSILGWVVLGLVAGAIAKLIMPGNDPGGFIVTILLGIIGALIGGFLGSLIFGQGLGSFWNLQTWIVAIVGSLILLIIYRLAIGRRGVWRY
ncbi:MAG: GlsB/YeaQ/YmgE family stress response membrane protein [Pseudonocardiaceae bacterium]